MTQGIFISFEGVDGAGKTTQVELLERHLRDRGAYVVTTREPGGTSLGVSIRRLLLDVDALEDPMAKRAEALLFAADRAQHVAQLIRPALERGDVVLTDRYLDSSIAYQAGGRELSPEEIRDLSMWATNGLLPDRTYLLDIDPALSRHRLGQTEDRMESAGDTFQARTRQAFLGLAVREPDRFLVVDATQPVQHIARIIADDCDALLARLGQQQDRPAPCRNEG